MGSVIGESGKTRVFQVTGTESSPLIIAPQARKWIKGDFGDKTFQILVSSDAGQKVVLKGSDGNSLSATGLMTRYSGGTLLRSGILSVSGNALGQNWVGLLTAPQERTAPAFVVEDPKPLSLGNPAYGPTTQPFLLFVDTKSAASDDLTYGVIDIGSQRTLTLRHGLGQRKIRPPKAMAQGDVPAKFEAFDNDFRPPTPGGVSPSGKGFACLIKTGEGTLEIDSDMRELALAEDEGLGTKAIDGAHHLGGTFVKEGALIVRGGEATVPGDHFRGSLGRVWKSFQGSSSLTAYDSFERIRLRENALVVDDPYYVFYSFYNPLRIGKGARVLLDRSQFFSALNTEADSLFEVAGYTLGGVTHYPQIAVTLNGNNSTVDGLLKGAFHLVLDSRRGKRHPVGYEHKYKEEDAVLFLNNPENRIFDRGETLVSTGH